jgi:hypothetical protein
MDTTHIAYTAEDLISYKLQHSGLLVAKPKFDREGADLLVLMNVENGAKFCRIQCKGRSLLKTNSRSHVEVPKTYIKGAFILILFIDDGDEHNTNLFCFFPNDIMRRWKLKTFINSKYDYYQLSLSKTSFQDPMSKGNFLEFKLNNQKIEEIKNVIRKADINEELMQMADLLKNQNDLIKLQNEKHKLDGLLTQIKHKEEIINISEENIKLREEKYQYLESKFKADKSNC